MKLNIFEMQHLPCPQNNGVYCYLECACHVLLLFKQAFRELSWWEVGFHCAHELQHQTLIAALRHYSHTYGTSIACKSEGYSRNWIS
jgi:hypothetical protein